MAGERTPVRGLRVRPGLVIPEAELLVRRTRSGGPGGQNVNKVATRIELEWDVVASSVLSGAEKARLCAKLQTRMSTAGVLRVVAQSERTQARNEAEARRRLAEWVGRALLIPKARRATRPTRASKTERIQTKRHRGDLKRSRRTAGDD
jgi:ribosome-associated protein